MAKSKKPAGETEVPMDRRRNSRREAEGTATAEAPKTERRKVQRRRQIDPTTCERDYSNDEIEFMQAMDAYKRSSGRMFPTCSEILEVVRGLGYQRDTQSTADPAEGLASDADGSSTAVLDMEPGIVDADAEMALDSLLTTVEDWEV